MQQASSLAALLLFALACRQVPPAHAPPPQAEPIETGALETAVVGTVVRARGRIVRTQDDAPYGYKIWIDDGSGECQVFIDASTELIGMAAAWHVGDWIEVTGLVAKYESTFEIVPRAAVDIALAPAPPD